MSVRSLIQNIQGFRSLRRRRIIEQSFIDSPEIAEVNITEPSDILNGLPSENNNYNLEQVVQNLVAGVTGGQNVITINELANLPEPVGNVITLEDNKVYVISGEVNLGNNRIVMGSDTTIRGRSPKLDFFTSTTTGALITASTSFRLFEIGFQANSGTIFDLNGTGSEICLMFGVRFFGTGALGDVADYDLFEVTTGLFTDYSAGLTFSGANGTCLLLDVTFFDTTEVTSLNFGTATFNSIKISECDFTVPNNGTGVSIATLGANINSGGAGIVNTTSFNLTGNAIAIANYTSLEDEWVVNTDNIGVIKSDRLLPSGWGFYSDGESSPATQSLSSTFQKLQIDGNGGTTEESYLPASIRGISSLWDTTNDKITPITVGDSYTLRIDIEITAKGGGAGLLLIQLDIGGGATPSIVIVDRFASLGKTPPFTVSVSFNMFTLNTFVTNGGQIFVATDTGTATIASRSILIERNTSGAI